MNIEFNLFLIIDLVVILFLVLMAFLGYKRGFLRELVHLLCVLVSLLVAWFFAPICANFYTIIKLDPLQDDLIIIKKVHNISIIINVVIYFVIIFIVVRLFFLVLDLIFKRINKIPVLGFFNKFLGFFAGLIKGIFIILICSLLLKLPIFDNQQEIKEKTVFRYIDDYSEVIFNYIIDNVDLKRLKYKFDSFDVEDARNDFKEWIINFKNE